MTTLEQFISICYALMNKPVVYDPPKQDLEELKEAMQGFERIMSLSTPSMPTKEDLALD